MSTPRDSIDTFGAELLVVAGEVRWSWRHSWWTGFWFGPIPVGFLLAIPLLVALAR